VYFRGSCPSKTVVSVCKGAHNQVKLAQGYLLTLFLISSFPSMYVLREIFDPKSLYYHHGLSASDFTKAGTTWFFTIWFFKVFEKAPNSGF
jgi:hypothetical protein